MGGVDALNGVCGRHLDVHQDDVGLEPPGLRQNALVIGCIAHDLDPRNILEETPRPLAHEVLVLCD
jgi:hypothetical protein